MKAAGSYSRDPATGELTLIHRTEEAATPEVAAVAQVEETLHVAEPGETPIAVETETVEAPVPASRKTRRG